jgi:hypothetical protein
MRLHLHAPGPAPADALELICGYWVIRMPDRG